MNKITALEPQAKRRNRFSVFVNGDFFVGISDTVVVDLGLYVGKELTKKELEEIKTLESDSKALEKSYRLLSFRPRSVKEIQDRLLEKFSSETVDRVIDKLKKYGYLNDHDFARAWVDSRRAGRGPVILRRELGQKGIDKEITEEVLADYEESFELSNAEALIAKKSRYNELEKNDFYKRAAPFLLRRGFSYPVIKRLIEKKFEKK